MRNIIITLMLLILLIVGFTFLNKAETSDSNKTQGKGLVIYRDRILEPPFEFSGIGEDTLRLNGIPYSPVRVDQEMYRMWKEKQIEHEIELMKKIFPDSVVQKKLAERERRKKNPRIKPDGTHALRVYAHKRADSAETFEEEVATYARIMAESPLVDSTKIVGDNWVAVYWKYMSPEPDYSTFLREKHPPLTEEKHKEMKTDHQEDHVEDFWETYNSGGVIVFGFGGYLYSRDSSKKEMTLKAIEKLSRGDTLTSLEKEESVFKEPFGKELLFWFEERFKRERGGER